MLSTLSIAKLAVAYNSLAAALELKPVKKFADRATALKRVGDLVEKLEAAGKILVHDDSGAITISEPAPEPKPEVVAEKPASLPAVPAAEKPAQKTKAPKPGRPPAVSDNDVIVVLTEGGKNPKKGQAANRFAKYQSGLTVAQYIIAIAKLSNDAEPRRQGLRDLAWDIRMGWVKVVGAKAYARQQAQLAKAEPAPEAKAA